MICADEKTSIQARTRKHDTLPAAPALPVRVEHECARAGALAYLAAWDVHHARVFGRCEPTTGIDPFDRLVDQVMTSAPYASARRGSGSSTTARLTAASPPWIGCTNDFRTLDELETRLLQFQDYYQQIATPFEWKFTKADLNDLLDRITAHEHAQLTPAA